ncbi:MAG: class I SAM-dependent methyltransferase [Acidiphilium sp.]|nr:class I SAM-dependent methyltransferase [Acidiphilium sp.]MDD4934582.1 class I SAM-dependent methyltransferase [Acidiphilium sp.]
MADTSSTDTVDFGFSKVARAQKSQRVRAVFDSVARRYDVMNDLMSLGVHRLWKREFVGMMDPRPHLTLLDLAGGTGDISFHWHQRGGGPVLLTDINEQMLGVGRSRAETRGLIGGISFAVTDAEALPLADGTVDRVSIAFGLRNCTDKDKVLSEALRVLKPGGRFFCLEFSKLQVAVAAPLYERWSFAALPAIGAWVADDRESYQYLAESIRMFPDQETLAGMMRRAGFGHVAFRNLTGGIAAIHSGWRL